MEQIVWLVVYRLPTKTKIIASQSINQSINQSIVKSLNRKIVKSLNQYMDLSLKNKNAIIGGGSRGIGKAAAIELALLGANVTLLARDEDVLKAALKELDITQGQIHDYFVADFSNAEKLEVSLKSFFAEKQYHILINNTGGPPPGAAATAPLVEYIQAFNNHLLCNQVMVQLVLGGMKKSGYGRIINVISTSVKQPLDNLGVSNTIRGAVANWAKTLSNELGKFGITVNNVLPGATHTGRLQSIIERQAGQKGLTAAEILHEFEGEIPVGRVGKPEEIGAAIAFLASPSASYINGVNLPVDGGRTKSL
jgi:3-oxoacyl-[acyl-carrier protein] reductase